MEFLTAIDLTYFFLASAVFLIVVGFSGNWVSKWKQNRTVTKRLRKIRLERENTD